MRLGPMFVLLSLLISACAVGNKYDYHTPVPSLEASTSLTVAVGVRDRRVWVVEGSTERDFVGLQYGGYGAAFDVTTQSGESLATDVTTVIVNGLKGKGVAAAPLGLAPDVSRGGAVQAIRDSGAERAILVTLHKWRSETLETTLLLYDVSVDVFDGNGKFLATNRSKERKHLGAADTVQRLLSPSDTIGAHVGAAYARILADLLNDPKILSALRSTTAQR